MGLTQEKSFVLITEDKIGHNKLRLYVALLFKMFWQTKNNDFLFQSPFAKSTFFTVYTTVIYSTNASSVSMDHYEH
jgi:hypothetical protein